uniref:Uncharacterized protein n=1 Tax=viral metagenome TaxID=1070528 RepID=A0A6M3J6E7_9ZZZZ
MMGFFTDVKHVFKTGKFLKEQKEITVKIEQCVKDMKAAIDDEHKWFIKNGHCDNLKKGAG